MEKKPLLPDTRVAILGLGLMGGSLAMALRGQCGALYGIDPDPDARALASRWDIVDQVGARPEVLLPEADMIILAAPVQKIIDIIAQLPELHPGNPVVMDLGSTKTRITAAMEALPERFDPIGAHPMAGKERASIVNAETGLYHGAPFALVPLPRTTTRAQELALEVVLAVGARPLWLDSDTHDRWVGATSHLPYLVANALAAVTPAEAAPMVGPGFRSTARLAPSTLNMMLDILVTNREHLLESVHQFHKHFEDVEAALLAEDLDRLRWLLEQGSENYDIVTGYRRGS